MKFQSRDNNSCEEMNILSVDSEEELEIENKIYCLDAGGSEEHEVFVTTCSMTAMYEPEDLGQVPLHYSWLWIPSGRNIEP
jgi:hypothetical protein